MTSRFPFLVAAFLCAVLAPIGPASAQTEMPLRASYQGQFLPEGTEVIVLSKEGRVRRDGRVQPEFFPTDEFPRASSVALRRDRLGDSGRSNRSYSGTQDSGRLYFIYALTPDSTLYWSYSAQRDSLKYDVVSTGVMSVAPILAADIREDVLASFFRPRVTVVMRGGEEEEEEGEEEGEEVALMEVSGGSDVDELTGDTVIARAEVPPVASASPPIRPASSGVTLPPFLAWSLLMLVIAAVGVPAYLARTYYGDLKQVRREMLTVRSRMASGGHNERIQKSGENGRDQQPESGDQQSDSDQQPESGEKTRPSVFDAPDDDRTELQAALEDANLRYEQLEEDYEILQARYAALEKELAAQRA